MKKRKKGKHKFIKPKLTNSEKLLDVETSKKLDFFINFPLKSANNLSQKLYKNDTFYKQTTYAWVGEKDAKKLFLFGVCKEVIKIIVDCVQIRDSFRKIPIKQVHDFLGNVIIGSYLDNQNFRLRKAIELLTLLILFSNKTTNDEEYRIYLSAENLDLQLSRQKEFKDFFDGISVSNTQHSIDDFSGRIEQDLKSLSKKDIWFLDMDKFRAKNPTVFKSKRALYLSALELADDDLRVMLGVSYHKTYSRLSLSAHPVLGSHDYGDKENDYRQVIRNIPTISLVCMHVMKLAYSLANEDDPNGIDKFLGKNNERSEASKLIAKMKSDFELEDLALTAWEDLVQIIDKKESKYGYKAYKVKYISRPPLLEFSEDWLEAQHILKLLMKKSAARSYTQKSFALATDPMIKDLEAGVLSQSDDVLMNNIKTMFLDLHKNKILIPMLVKNGQLKPIDKSSLI